MSLRNLGADTSGLEVAELSYGDPPQAATCYTNRQSRDIWNDRVKPFIMKVTGCRAGPFEVSGRFSLA